jgi:hypothetical protein
MLSKDVDEMNEKLVDICVSFCTTDGLGKYTKTPGFGEDEIYRHYLKKQVEKVE